MERVWLHLRRVEVRTPAIVDTVQALRTHTVLSGSPALFSVADTAVNYTYKCINSTQVGGRVEKGNEQILHAEKYTTRKYLA